ncbi:hypothetical protein CHS0354_006439 [Potamilus streckersoni]|uniref:Uncharacterized protein n=1 Tax=Potamilus streckersoni TaxID=2493646 RepID=A0AAE0T986_9BIVA|nr:hypothetical protein CHS0354_006439 [Potamilus streckersoni]
MTCGEHGSSVEPTTGAGQRPIPVLRCRVKLKAPRCSAETPNHPGPWRKVGHQLEAHTMTFVNAITQTAWNVICREIMEFGGLKFSLFGNASTEGHQQIYDEESEPERTIDPYELNTSSSLFLKLTTQLNGDLNTC